MQPIVQLCEGQIKGTSKTDLNGESFHSFLSIPYGKAPVGNLRFKPPKPVEPWKGVKDATKEDNIGFQLNFITQQIGGTEDCLNLHVFTKSLPNEGKQLKPVMVYIHGGGFLMGSHDTSLLGPEYLMTEDIVLVTITYRVGFLGFLSFNDPSLDVTGNAGLKDQVLALKWVQKNIKNFNGDPSNVTIFGGSAGGASVELLILSPTAKNLFHKAIIQSGSTLNPWARGHFDPVDLANYLGEPNISEKELLKKLTDMPIEQLYDIQIKYIKPKNKFGNMGVVGPIVEKPNPTAFLSKEPMEIIQSGEYNTVPIIIGYTDNEGASYQLFEQLNQTDKGEIGFQIEMENLFPYETDLADAELVTKISETLKTLYVNEENQINKSLIITDTQFVVGIITSAKHQAKASKHPVYLYRFTVDAGLNVGKKLGQLNDCPGACHGDDLGYLFKTSLPLEMGEFEKMAVKRMVTLLTNFAKYGNPTPEGNDLNIEWKPIENDSINFLDIGRELKMGVDPEANRMKIWKKAFQLNPLTANY